MASMSLAGRISDWAGRLPALLPSLVWGAAVLWLLARVGSVPLLVAGCAAIGIAVGAVAVVPPTMVVDLAPIQAAGVAGFRICADLGMLAGAAGAGALAGAAGGPAALEIAGIALLAGALLALWVRETRPRRLRTLSAGGPSPVEPIKEVIVK
jgi:MFS family permease